MLHGTHRISLPYLERVATAHYSYKKFSPQVPIVFPKLSSNILLYATAFPVEGPHFFPHPDMYAFLTVPMRAESFAPITFQNYF